MLLNNALIAILVLSVTSLSVKGDIEAEGDGYNFRTGSSSSVWLEKVVNHPRPKPPGCQFRPRISRHGNGDEREHPHRTRVRCCRNQCVDVFSDINNCGFCGIRCPIAWQCCRGFCIDTNVNPFNCGRCSNKCPCGVPCVYGLCGYAEPSPWPRPRPWPRPPSPFLPPGTPEPCLPKHPHPPQGCDQPPAISQIW